MLAVINERQITEQQEELMELKESTPEKFDHEFEFKLNNKAADKKPDTQYRTYTREEVQKLLEASHKLYEPPVPIETTDYPIMSRELAERLVREHLEYKKENVKKERTSEWDSLKTIELETKTDTTMKPLKSMKGSKRLATRTKKS